MYTVTSFAVFAVNSTTYLSLAVPRLELSVDGAIRASLAVVTPVAPLVVIVAVLVKAVSATAYVLAPEPSAVTLIALAIPSNAFVSSVVSLRHAAALTFVSVI